MKIYKLNNRWYIQVGRRTVSSPDLWQALKVYVLGCIILLFLASCSAPKLQKFKELNSGPTSRHYKDTTINGQFVRIPIEKPAKPKTEQQKKKDRQYLAIAALVTLTWYLAYQEYGN